MYRVLCDGLPIYDLRDEDLVLIDPKLDLEVNKAGSFSFKMPPQHPQYYLPQQMLSCIQVFQDSEEVFSGRITGCKIDFYNRKQITCEGQLAYLNDSIQRPAEYHDVTVRGYLETLIAEHNKQVAKDKQFKVGIVTVTDGNDSLYRYTNYNSTMKEIKEDLVDDLGGYLRVRNVNGTAYLDYIEDYENISKQSIEFGENLLDFSRNTDVTDIATVEIPLPSSIVKQAVDQATALITERTSGYVVTTGNEQLIMDTNDIHTAKRLWRWNLNGLGYSGNGYNGPYSTAITMDGQIVGERLIGGSVSAEKLDITYRNQVIKEIADAEESARSDAKNYTNGELKKYYTKSEVETSIKNTKDSILLSASESATQYVDNQLKNYAKSSDVNVSINGIRMEVSDTYTKKSETRSAFAMDSTDVTISTGRITFNSNTIVINSTNFTLDSKGNVSVKGVFISTGGDARLGTYAKLNNADYAVYYDDYAISSYTYAFLRGGSGDTAYDYASSKIALYAVDRTTKSIQKRVTITPLEFKMDGIHVNLGKTLIDNLQVKNWYVGYLDNKNVGYLPTYIKKITVNGETIRVIAIKY